MVFIRKIKKKSGTYMAKVESYRVNGKVKQRVIQYLGKNIDGHIARKTNTKSISLKHVKQSLDISVIDEISRELEINKYIEDKNILVLIYAQMLENRSINKLEQWLRFTEIPDKLGLKKITTANLYNALTSLSEIDFEEIETLFYNSFKRLETEQKAAIIDVTDTYFESNNRKEKVRKGKDGKIRKLAQFALAVSLEDGFPIFYNQYSGNLSDIQIFKDMNIKLKEKGLSSVILDRGMISKENLKMLLSLRIKTIAGLRKNPTFVKEFISKVDKNKIYSKDNRVKLKKTAVYIESFDYLHGTLIVIYNPQLEILKREHAFEKGIYEDKQYGFSLIYHNTNFEDSKVVKKYYEKDTVERAFKQLKGILNLRPIRVWLKEHVEGHFRICFISYAILSYMNFRLKKIEMTAVEALDSLKHGYKVRLHDEINSYEWDLMVPLEPKQKKIISALKCSV